MNASIFVLSSDYEGMPNALMEAMALGLACISTDCDGGGARELIKHGENGLLVEKGNLKELSNALDRLLAQRELREKLGSSASKFREEYSYENIYSKWLDFINDVILHGKKRR